MASQERSAPEDFRHAFNDALKVGSTPTTEEADAAIRRFSAVFDRASHELANVTTTEDTWEGYTILAQSLPKTYPMACTVRALDQLRVSESVGSDDYHSFIWARVLADLVNRIEQQDFTDDDELSTSAIAEKKVEILHELLQKIFSDTIPTTANLLSRKIAITFDNFPLLVELAARQAVRKATEQSGEQVSPQVKLDAHLDENNSLLQRRTEEAWELAALNQEEDLRLLSIIGNRRYAITELDVLLYAKHVGLLGFSPHSFTELYNENRGTFVSNAGVEKRIEKVGRQLLVEENIATLQNQPDSKKELSSTDSITLAKLHPVLAVVLDESGISTLERLLEVDAPDIKTSLSARFTISDKGKNYYLSALSRSIRKLVSDEIWLPYTLRRLRKWERTVLRPSLLEIEFSWDQTPQTPFADIPLFLLDPSKMHVWVQLAKLNYCTLGDLISDQNTRRIQKSIYASEFDLVEPAFSLFYSKFNNENLSLEDKKIMAVLESIPE